MANQANNDVHVDRLNRLKAGYAKVIDGSRTIGGVIAEMEAEQTLGIQAGPSMDMAHDLTEFVDQNNEGMSTIVASTDNAASTNNAASTDNVASTDNAPYTDNASSTDTAEDLGKKKRCIKTRDQLKILGQHFQADEKPSIDEKERIGAACGLTSQEVDNWFRNKRSKRYKKAKKARIEKQEAKKKKQEAKKKSGQQGNEA